ncbi:MAG: GDP-mannose dehydrogenase, partial [Phycisphaerae bacterium]|nr:GDP-mannose dehydrogenase [Phycisphaerae bacterium]
MAEYSISPAGEQFAVPEKDQYDAEFKRIESLAEAAREDGKEVVVVMGVGFVGAVMAAIVADCVDKDSGEPNKFVIGCQ